jgi:hypothetical protein
MEQEAEQGSFTVQISKAQRRTEATTGAKAYTKKLNQRTKVFLPLDKETVQNCLLGCTAV